MNSDRRTRVSDWRKRIRSILHSQGYETIEDYVCGFPAEPYVKLAKRLNADVAAMQLSWMQLEEAQEQGRIRGALVDCLVRCITGTVKRGWLNGKDFASNAALAYALWAGEVKRTRPDLEPLAWTIWQELRMLHPPRGWLPNGPDDLIIQAAFAKAWPHDDGHQV